jgi:hypothetical protein
MIISFTIFKTAQQWESESHQLNSDVLQKNVQIKGGMGYVLPSFTYCEESKTGQISDPYGEMIGEFSILPS